MDQSWILVKDPRNGSAGRDQSAGMDSSRKDQGSRTED